MQLRDAPSVGAVATAALEQAPKELVFVRVKEDTKVLIPRCGLVRESFATHLDIAESPMRSFSAEDWERLRSYPMIVETLCDHNETQQNLVDGDRRAPASNSNNRIGHARAVAFPQIPKDRRV